MSETSRSKFLGECLTGAVEGGSNYWCEFKPDSYNFDDEENVTVWAREDAAEAGGRPGYTGPQWKKIDNARIERGITFLLEKKTKIHQSYKNIVWGASQTNDSGGEMDKTTFDAILQCAILGDVIYG